MLTMIKEIGVFVVIAQAILYFVPGEHYAKYVKVLVSSNSGAGIGGEGARVYNSMITVFGTVKDFDKQFIELENTTTIYYSGVVSSYESMGLSTITNVRQPSAFENKSSLLNLNNVIEISMVE